MVCVCERHALHDLDPTRLHPQNDTIHRLLKKERRKVQRRKVKKERRKKSVDLFIISRKLWYASPRKSALHRTASRHPFVDYFPKTARPLVLYHYLSALSVNIIMILSQQAPFTHTRHRTHRSVHKRLNKLNKVIL